MDRRSSFTQQSSISIDTNCSGDDYQQSLGCVMQQTLARPIRCSGIAVHSGKKASLCVLPAPAGSGIVFKRVDITHKNNLIPCTVSAVTQTKLCTSLSNEQGVGVSTIEHLMSALNAFGVDNALIEIDSEELPIMDGSAAPYVFLLEASGLVQQQRSRRVIKITKEVCTQIGDAYARFSPAECFSFSFEIEFAHKAIGKQSYALESLCWRDYRTKISRGRTFGFYEQIDAMRKQGYGQGGSFENAIFLGKDTVLNKDGLRYPDEFVRHKMLDSIGDIFICGHRILGHFHGHKAGHSVNIELLRTLETNRDCWEFIEQKQPISSHAIAFGHSFPEQERVAMAPLA